MHIFVCEFTCSGNARCEANRWGLHGVDAAVLVVAPDRRAGQIHARIYWSRNGALQLCRVRDAGGVAAMPAKVMAAFLNLLKPSMTFVLNLTLRWSCSITSFKYFEDRTFVSWGNTASAFISRTARCEAA